MIASADAARGMTIPLRQWIMKQLDSELAPDLPARFGLDIVEGQVRPVAHSLLDVVQASQAH